MKMTKLNFDYSEISSKLLYKIENTYESLDKVITLGNSVVVPSGFNSSRYTDSLNKLKRVSTGLKNTKTDLIEANKNYEEMDAICKKKNSEFNSLHKIPADESIINLN